jgi:phosphohistidine phosphatase
MKTIYLVRHAKSNQNHEGLADIDRPLNDRGYKAAAEVSAKLKKVKEIAEILVTSPAVRTYSTALIFARAFNISPNTIIIRRSLYEAPAENYLEAIRQCQDTLSSVAIFGHNPSMTDCVNKFGELRMDNLPTCGVVRFDFNVDKWEKVSFGTGEFRFFERPARED